MRRMSCKRNILLSLVVMAATALACSGAFADAFNGITANPSTAGVGTTVSISFQANLTQSVNPVVTVNGHPATYSNSWMRKYFTYSYTVSSSDPGGPATIYITGYGGSTSNTTALSILDNTPPTCTCQGSPSMATAGDTVTLTVVASEALMYPPTVGIYDWRDGSYAWANYTGSSGNTYYFTYTVQLDDPEGTAIAVVWGTDLSSNVGRSDTTPYFVTQP